MCARPNFICRSSANACASGSILLNSRADSKRAFLSAISLGEAKRSQWWKRGVEERSTLTARASHIIEARGTLVSLIRPGFDQQRRKNQALSLRRPFG